MDIKDFIKSFSEVIEDNSENPITCSFDENTKYKEIDSWGSLTAVMTIVMIEEQFEKQITTDDFEACDTLGALYQLIETK